MRRGAAAAGSALALMLAALGPAEGSDSFVGIPAASMGQHGPAIDILDGLELVGRSDLALPGKPALGNHGGLALIDDCAYVGRWHDYRGRNPIAIVDVSDPSAPQAIGTVAGSTRSGGVTREIRAVDLPETKMLVAMIFGQNTPDRTNNHLLFYGLEDGDCTAPVLLGTFDMRAFRGHEFFLWIDPEPVVGPAPRVLVVVTAPIGPPNILVVDASDPTTPLLVGLYDAGQPVVSPDEAAGTYLGTYAHSIALSDDGSEAYVSYWDGGYFTLDASAVTTLGGTFTPKGAMSVPLRYAPNEMGNVHSAAAIPNTNAVVLGHEVYQSTDGCPYGWMRIVDKGSPTAPPAALADFRLDANDPIGCTDMPGMSAPIVPGPVRQTVDARNVNGDLIDGTFTMHNQTVVDSYVITSWYGAGLRVVDVGELTAPSEVAFFVPAPNSQNPSPIDGPQTTAPTWGVFGTSADDWLVAMWSSPIIRDGLIYVTDVRNGLYILRATPGTPLADALQATSFAEGNSNLGYLR